eukprot:7225108-Pyramimonas_sp.AAC.1
MKCALNKEVARACAASQASPRSIVVVGAAITGAVASNTAAVPIATNKVNSDFCVRIAARECRRLP